MKKKKYKKIGETLFLLPLTYKVIFSQNFSVLENDLKFEGGSLCYTSVCISTLFPSRVYKPTTHKDNSRGGETMRIGGGLSLQRRAMSLEIHDSPVDNFLSNERFVVREVSSPHTHTHKILCVFVFLLLLNKTFNPQLSYSDFSKNQKNEIKKKSGEFSYTFRRHNVKWACETTRMIINLPHTSLTRLT